MMFPMKSGRVWAIDRGGTGASVTDRRLAKNAVLLNRLGIGRLSNS